MVFWSTVTDQRLEIRKCDQPTNLRTNQLTWVGARDTCVSKNWRGKANLIFLLRIHGAVPAPLHLPTLCWNLFQTIPVNLQWQKGQNVPQVWTTENWNWWLLIWSNFNVPLNLKIWSFVCTPTCIFLPPIRPLLDGQSPPPSTLPWDQSSCQDKEKEPEIMGIAETLPEAQMAQGIE